MKVALCFYGQPRYINNPYVWLSHKYWIIDKYNTDVYVHSWISGSEKEFEFSDWVQNKQNITEDINSSNIILNKYKPKKYIFESPKEFSLDEQSKNLLKQKEKEYCSRINGSFLWSDLNENNCLSHLYSISKVLNLCEKDYDWIILTRFDNYIKNFPNLYNLDNNGLYLDNQFLYNFSDVLVFGGYQHVITLDCYNGITELCNDIRYFSPEEFKRVAYQKVFGTLGTGDYEYIYGIEKRIRIDVSIVRSNTLEDMQI